MSVLSEAKSLIKQSLNAVQAPRNRKEFLSSLHNDENKPAILLTNTAAYRNLGDHAITMGEYAFLDHYFPGYQVIEITAPQWRNMRGLDIKYSMPDVEAVFLHGGGYMGTLWGGNEENNAMSQINHAGDLPCVYFPQTVFYEGGSAAVSLKERQKFYQAHENTLFCMRDRRSYDFMRKEFSFAKTRTIYTPDIALFLDDPIGQQARYGVTLCFRHDEEKASDDASLKHIVALLDRQQLSHHYTDTVADHSFPLTQREDEVHDKLREFKSSQLVITDRLHAMVFCAITHTPCIAFNNINGKVEGVNQWIKDLDYVRLTVPEAVTEDLIAELIYCDTSRSQSTRQLLQGAYDDMSRSLAGFTGLRMQVQGE